MEKSFTQIKQKFEKAKSKRYWGDDFDVRYYLASKLKQIENKVILDIGGGIGIISSELNNSNSITNLDLSFEDLKISKNSYEEVSVINSSMINLPFADETFDIIICSHILEIAKEFDLKNENVKINSINEYPTVNRVLEQMYKILKKDGIGYITTPNNAYYKSSKLSYDELTIALQKYFEKKLLYHYNTYPKLSKKSTKLNLANSIPKIRSKFSSHSKIINSLIKKDENSKKESVSFYAEVMK